MFWFVVLAFVGAAAVPAMWRMAGARTAAVLALVPAAIFIGLLLRLGEVTAGAVVVESWPWVPALNVALGFRLDGLSLLFALLVSGVGIVVLTYAGTYLEPDRLVRFLVVILLFMGSMLGLVLADDLLLLFVFWELTSITSYLLVGYDHERPEARSAALQALLVTSGGGLALLVGVLLLGYVAGTFSVSAMLDHGDLIRRHPLYGVILTLVCLGALTKSAQVPFHFWLPAAMAAPSPVSAYLHSATMVKAGLYLLARLAAVLGGTDAWHYGLVLPGAATMIVGAVMALGQDDVKRLLAYTTVSALGVVTLLLGLDTEAAVKAAMVFIVVHALYKGALFLAAGSLDHGAGTRELSGLGGLRSAMPLTATVAMLAALSMAGLPPLFGFVAKELLYEAKTQAPNAAAFVTGAGVATNMLIAATAGLVGLRPFIGRRPAGAAHAHEGAAALWVGPLVLAMAGLVFGVMPGLTVEPLVAAAVTAVRAEHTEVTLQLWHGLSPILLLSLVTVVGGGVVYVTRDALVARAAPYRHLTRLGPTAAYTAALSGLLAVARAQTRLLQNGRLSSYVRTTVATCALATSWVLVTRSLVRLPPVTWPAAHEAAVLVLMVAGGLAAARSRSRLSAVASLGVTGFGVALTFLIWSGPDLAMTQFAIETLSVLLFVFVVYRLPRLSLTSRWPTRLVNATVAGAAGLTIALLLWAVTNAPHDAPLKHYFGAAAFPEGQGRNVVNVILVDFRAFDTLGEITVLAVAALGVHALLRLAPEDAR
jgi:multicomponent Na+:H+ antiporter subunit A